MPRFEQGPLRKDDSPEPQQAFADSKPPQASPETEPNAEETQEQPVLVDGRLLGLECQKVELSQFMATDFPECYLETASGNIYGVFKQNDGLVVADARSNLGKGQGAQAAPLSSDIVARAVLRVGQPFDFGSGNTSALARITIVTRSHFLLREPTPEEEKQIAKEQTGGRTSDVRSQFRTIIGRAS